MKSSSSLVEEVKVINKLFYQVNCLLSRNNFKYKQVNPTIFFVEINNVKIVERTDKKKQFMLELTYEKVAYILYRALPSKEVIALNLLDKSKIGVSFSQISRSKIFTQ